MGPHVFDPCTTQPTQRGALLEAAAASEGAAWAAWWLDEMRRQARPVCGGWPGTLSEARRRMVKRIAAELGVSFAPTAAELDSATRAAYGQAKRDWNLSCEPDLE